MLNGVVTNPSVISRTVDGDASDGDIVNAGDGRNLVFGDNGQITAASANTDRFGAATSTIGLNVLITLGRADTTDSLIGGADDLTTGSGNDIVLGGIDGDTINAGQGNNIVLGDSGYIAWTSDDVDPSDIDRIYSTDPDHGGSDNITTGDGQDIIIGGEGGG